MKRVKLYKVTEYEQWAYPTQEYIEYIGFDPNAKWTLLDGGDYMIQDEIITERIPIKRYNFANGKEVLAALPKELVSILNIEIDATEKLHSALKICDQKTVEIAILKSEMSLFKIKIQEMPFWNRLKFLFTGKMNE